MSERPGADRVPDLRAVGLAGLAWFGATVARPAGALLLLTMLGALVARASRRRRQGAVLAGVSLALATSTLAAGSLQGLEAVEPGPREATVVLVTDPEVTGDGRLLVDVRLDGARLWAEARAPLAVARLRDRLAGEQVLLRGTVAAWDGRPDWATARHLAARLRIESVAGVGRGAAHAAAANGLRRLLAGGAESLTDERQALLAGLTLGDDRSQSPATISDFRASGLTHLLAVSGQNVAFLMVVSGALLRRLRIWPRFVAGVAIVAAFAFVTRFEPSVVRAAAMAVVAMWATTIGKPSGGLRNLSLAVCALLVIDPLLTRSVGFRLSVAACVGVLLLAPPIADRLRGPRWVREGLAITAGAQLAVAPVLIPAFGPMPLAALPANIVAGPIAGFVMVWGITAGAFAGLAGGALAALVHVPTALALGTLERVASSSAALPFGTVDMRGIVALALAAALLALAGPHRAARQVLAVGLAAAVALAALSVPAPVGEVRVGWGASVWTDGSVAVVDLGPGTRAVDVLDVLRARRVRVVGAIVVRSGRSELVAVVESVRSRFPVHVVIAPASLPAENVVVPESGARFTVGGLVVEVDKVEPALDARIGWSQRRAAPAHR